eukprot:TRINITY_DN7980_c0_g1_i1.p3 TRINITY_DN7980_c0_g1~~TRINITY_DN7980_c0_g1_i1.p3  ORF type:complete len:271 (+),score=86.99 TRINITY_DN7980_c0_g1_i1:68-880(+)
MAKPKTTKKTTTKPQKVAAPAKESIHQKTPRNFGIGQNIQPTRDLTRFVRWPKYVRLQRQRRVLYKRLKVPPTVNQFTQTLDKALATQVFKLAAKYSPENKQEKKLRLKEEAEAKVDSAAHVGPTTKKRPMVIKQGINHITRLVEQKQATLVLIAHDVDPIEIVLWLPALCRKMDVPYAIVKSKSRLGALVHQKTAAALAFTKVKSEDKNEFAKIVTAVNAHFNDKAEEIRKKWGGNVMGSKSLAATRKFEEARAREGAIKASLQVVRRF